MARADRAVIVVKDVWHTTCATAIYSDHTSPMICSIPIPARMGYLRRYDWTLLTHLLRGYLEPCEESCQGNSCFPVFRSL